MNAFNCTAIVWEPPEDDGGENIEYRVRIYAGNDDYRFVPPSQRRVISSTTTWAVTDWIPTQRPVYVKVQRGL